uniref:Fluoride ion transporter CrcB n=1 Tax=Globisporangium ultimum (strain ATCC 200006 / CBS 805.95 / DAOM BR144) TaxID=431595 RepID=K3WL52_GLOUD
MLSEDDSDLESGGNPNAPRRNNSVPQSRWTKCRSSLHIQVPIVVSIALGAYFGVGIRVLLTEFAKTLSSSQAELLELLGFSYFLPNVVGCFVMGFAVRWKPLLRDQFAVYFSGIMTGFCGCCTTFASWDLGVAAMFVHGRWLNAFLMLFVQIASAISSFRCGYHAGEGLVQYFTVNLYKFRKPPVDMNQLKLNLERNISCMRSVKANVFGQLVSRRVRATEQALVISRDACTELISEIAQVEQDFHRVQHNAMQWALTGVFVTVWLWVVPFVGFSNYASSRLLALSFGPFGALLRYYLSLNNSKPKWKHFPFYTFLPNFVASILSCVMEVIGSSIAADHVAGSDAFKAYILFGEGAIQVGFLGSLSTVSSWVNELDGLSSRRFYWAYRYAFVSVVISQLASIFVLGMYQAYGNGPLLI